MDTWEGWGRQSGAQEMGFAAGRKGSNPRVSPTMRPACALTRVCVFVCDVVRLLALLPAGHWDDTMRKSEDSASGLAHVTAHCM